MAAEEEIDVVLTVGELDGSVVALREFLHRTGAVGVQAVLDRGERPPAHLSCGRLEPIEVTTVERTVHLPHAVDLAPAPPDGLPSIPALPPVEVDAGAGVITGPLGGVEAMARSVVALAELLGGQSVALAFWPTTDPDVPLGVGARAGERPIVTRGEEQFHLP